MDLDAGKYIDQPPVYQIRAASSVAPTLLPLVWITKGSGISGDEKGSVTYDVKFVVGQGDLMEPWDKSRPLSLIHPAVVIPVQPPRQFLGMLRLVI
jgi:hypothetical protein